MSDPETAKLKAFVLGGTGEVGKALVKELSKRAEFGEVTLISRRLLELPLEAQGDYSKFNHKLINFDELSKNEEAFSGYDIGFCALGTTRSKSGREGFYRVDHDYVVESAKLAKTRGCQHFLIVTASGAKKSSIYYYLRVKGQVEEELIGEVKFGKLSIFRPSLLLCSRAESRPAESCARCFVSAFDCCRCMSIEVHILARVMVKSSLKKSSMAVEIFDNRTIYRIGRIN